jgi:hypothetical protein
MTQKINNSSRVSILGTQTLAKGLGSDKLSRYLETVEPRDIRFYKVHGFTIVVEEIEPSSGVKFLIFRREAHYV